MSKVVQKKHPVTFKRNVETIFKTKLFLKKRLVILKENSELLQKKRPVSFKRNIENLF